ncbi:MAG: glutamine-hydrolyzing GMP synthase [Candidatus Curtissbacteria bacterium]|nr:glutamine-hydrolyzing GMP synthase [Candidatus Curtissbacteria bacterium]
MVIVVNFGGQFAHLIARRIRDLDVKSELVSPEISPTEIKKINPEAIILSGSPYSCYEKGAPKIDPKIYKLKLPILGICYGQQLMAYQLRGKVVPHTKKQFGKVELKISKSPLFKNLKSPQTVWFSHGDQVSKLPQGFTAIGSTQSAKFAAIQNLKHNFFGIQFHTEVSHTTKGKEILSNFLFGVSGANRDWTIKKVKEQIVSDLKNQIGDEKVLMAISGGVDSLVAAILIKEAVPKNLHMVFINTGLLRNYDVSDLKNVIKTVGFKNFKITDVSSRFIKGLKGVSDPEEKRKVIAKLYFKILEEEAKKIGNVKFLGQGTIYPDRIESAQTSKHADKIKSHHNVTLPSGLKLTLIEPLRDLYKDEVRKIGNLLGISRDFTNRHPFPGPGLAIRVLGEVTEERLSILREVDEIFISELKFHDIYNKVGQSLAALLPVKSVGVMGDSRTYSYIVSLRSVDTTDFMTADWSKIPHEVLEKISSRIVNEVRGVNRVVYDITQKPPATIEYE